MIGVGDDFRELKSSSHPVTILSLCREGVQALSPRLTNDH